MEDYKVSGTQLIKAYHAADEQGKKMIQSLFPEGKFELDAHEKVYSVESACESLGVKRPIVTVENMTESDAEAVKAYADLIIVTRAINEGRERNWSDSTECKWIPYFQMYPSFGFAHSSRVHGRSNAGVGSRLTFENEEKSEYAAKMFESLYSKMMQIK